MDNSKNLQQHLEYNLTYQIDYTANFNKSFRRKFHSRYMYDEITADEYAILLTINFRPDISQSELAKILFKGKAHIGKILNDMESRGFIRRIADTRDNIIVKRNELTEKGINIIEESLPKTECIRNAMDKEFSQEDIIQFTSYLKRYRKVLTSIVDVKLK